MKKDRSPSRSAEIDSESETLADTLEVIGGESVRISQNGREKWISRQEANIIALVNAAVQRDRKAAKTLLRYMKEMKSAPVRTAKTVVLIAEPRIPSDE